MQIVMEQVSSRSRQDLKKRISSANFNSKKIKTILSSRQTCNEIFTLKGKQDETKNDPSLKTIEIANRKGKRIQTQACNLKIRKVQNKMLCELIKPIKYDKTQEQSLLMKNCDKTKLIFWNKDIFITGNQKYLVISADLIIDQDCFWDKLPSDNGNFSNATLHNSNTLATLSHNSTQTYRSRNNFGGAGNGQGKVLGGSSQNIPNAIQRSKNPLLSSNKLTSLIREWKALHTKCDSQSRRLIVLWMIRKQATYTQLMEFTQANELPLHGIFYVKRKRANPFFDMGPIIKEIHQRFLEAVVNTERVEVKQVQMNEKKSIDSSREMRKGKSKEFKNKEITQSGSTQMKNAFDSVTNRVLRTKIQIKTGQQNDQNSSAALNSQTCKEFELSKNNKKSLGSILIDQKRVKSIMKKGVPFSSNHIIAKQASMKISNHIESEAMTNELRIKCDVSPMTMDDVKQAYSSGVIKEFDCGNGEGRRFMRPEIYVFEGVKCNARENCQGETYHGKVPLLFDCHEERLARVMQQLKEHNIEVDENKEYKNMKVYYFKYDSVKQNALQLLNSSVKELLKRGTLFNQGIYSAYQMRDFREGKIEEILSELSDETAQQNQLRPRNVDKSLQSQIQQIQLTEQQEEIVQQKTQKKLEEIKKQVIDHTISLKGRNFTFQNGQSIYYFVGDAFKRNYNLLYGEYYQRYEKEMLKSVLEKQKPKDHKSKVTNVTTNKKNDHSRATECTFEGKNSIQNSRRKQDLKLADVQFYDSSLY